MQEGAMQANVQAVLWEHAYSGELAGVCHDVKVRLRAPLLLADNLLCGRRGALPDPISSVGGQSPQEAE